MTQAETLVLILAAARDGGAQPPSAAMLSDGTVLLEFSEQHGSVRISPDGTADQVWLDSDGELHCEVSA
ncbi:MAG: hypothetical protein ACRD04_05660 [Terriglobales bacterium]